MADDQDGPLELADRPLERLARPDVEVVRRLVQDQEVRGRGGQPGQGGLGLLAAGELADRLEDDLAAQAEPAQEVADVSLDPLRVVLGPDGAEDGRLGAQRLEALVVVADLDLVAELDLALVGLLAADERLDERGLARAVGPHDPDALPAQDGEVEPLEEGLVVGLGEVRGLDHDVAGCGRPRRSP